MYKVPLLYTFPQLPGNAPVVGSTICLLWLDWNTPSYELNTMVNLLWTLHFCMKQVKVMLWWTPITSNNRSEQRTMKIICFITSLDRGKQVWRGMVIASQDTQQGVGWTSTRTKCSVAWLVLFPLHKQFPSDLGSPSILKDWLGCWWWRRCRQHKGGQTDGDPSSQLWKEQLFITCYASGCVGTAHNYIWNTMTQQKSFGTVALYQALPLVENLSQIFLVLALIGKLL